MLKRLQIRNFRRFNALEVDQLSGINLIAGKNNSGKTSLLEALNKLQDLLKSNFLPIAQRVRKNPRQFLGVSRSRRELGHSVLG